MVEMLREAGRHAGVEQKARGAALERRQPDGRAPPQHRAEKGAGKAAPAKKGKSKAKPEDLRRQPQFKFPIEGGKAKQPKAAAAPAASSKAKPKRKSA